jgi:hypothetical protein
MRISRLAVVAAVFASALSFTTPAVAQMDTLQQATERAVKRCENDLLCRHVRVAFRLQTYRESGPDGVMHRWRDPIRVVTLGLNDDGRAIFLDLLQGLAKTAGITVEVLPDTEIKRSNFLVAVAPDMAALLQQPWIASLNKVSASTGNDHTVVLHESNRQTFLLTRPSDDWSRPRNEHCIFGTTPARLQDKPGLLFARVIYRCLTGTMPSNMISPSLLNGIEAAAPLYAEPYARMSSLDRALLEVLYDPATPVESMAGANAANLITKKLHERGFGLDGNMQSGK